MALVPPQPVGWSFLAWTRAGTGGIRTDARLAMATPSTIVWIPAGERFAIEARARIDLRIIYLADGFVAPRAFGPLAASPILEAIVERAVGCGYLDPGDARDARLIAVAADEIAHLRALPLALVLPIPHDLRLRSALESALVAPDVRPTLGEMSVAAGMTVRTFQRRVKRETGISARTWMQRARLREAALALASRASLTETGLAHGYASSGAFITAYRHAFGITPGRARRSPRNVSAIAAKTRTPPVVARHETVS